MGRRRLDTKRILALWAGIVAAVTFVAVTVPFRSTLASVIDVAGGPAASVHWQLGAPSDHGQLPPTAAGEDAPDEHEAPGPSPPSSTSSRDPTRAAPALSGPESPTGTPTPASQPLLAPPGDLASPEPVAPAPQPAPPGTAAPTPSTSAGPPGLPLPTAAPDPGSPPTPDQPTPPISEPPAASPEPSVSQPPVNPPPSDDPSPVPGSSPPPTPDERPSPGPEGPPAPGPSDAPPAATPTPTPTPSSSVPAAPCRDLGPSSGQHSSPPSGCDEAAQLAGTWLTPAVAKGSNWTIRPQPVSARAIRRVRGDLLKAGTARAAWKGVTRLRAPIVAPFRALDHPPGRARVRNAPISLARRAPVARVAADRHWRLLTVQVKPPDRQRTLTLALAGTQRRPLGVARCRLSAGLRYRIVLPPVSAKDASWRISVS